jgi:hypothetical protein
MSGNTTNRSAVGTDTSTGGVANVAVTGHFGTEGNGHREVEKVISELNAKGLERRKLVAEILKIELDTKAMTAAWFKKPQVWAFLLPSIVSVVAAGLAIQSGALQARLDLIQSKSEKLAVEESVFKNRLATLASDEQALRQREAEYAKQRDLVGEEIKQLNKLLRLQPIRLLVKDVIEQPLHGTAMRVAACRRLADAVIEGCSNEEIARHYIEEALTSREREVRQILAVAALFRFKNDDTTQLVQKTFDNAYAGLGGEVLLHYDQGWNRNELSEIALGILSKTFATSKGLDRVRLSWIISSYGQGAISKAASGKYDAPSLRNLCGEDVYFGAARSLRMYITGEIVAEHGRISDAIGDQPSQEEVPESWRALDHLARLCPPVAGQILADSMARNEFAVGRVLAEVRGRTSPLPISFYHAQGYSAEIRALIPADKRGQRTEDFWPAWAIGREDIIHAAREADFATWRANPELFAEHVRRSSPTE